MDFQDKVLTCIGCGGEFVFTAGEQQFFAEKGFEHEPRRCRPCKARRKAVSARQYPRRSDYSVHCAQCGRDTTVPFKPAPGRPVYCRSCFERRRSAFG